MPMKIGALIVATGLPGASGIAALTAGMGDISVGQRMIAAFQRAGVSLAALVVGPEDKKAERQLVQNGVIFLRCQEDASFFQGVRQGLDFMADKFDRIFLVPGDMPLFLPRTLETLLEADAAMAVPVSDGKRGFPILLREQAAKILREDGHSLTLESAAEACETAFVSVEDPGILRQSFGVKRKTQLIRQQNRQLTRPMVEVALCKGAALFDPRLSMLLHLVDETRSVLLACSLMQISYSSAWNMLNHAEDDLGYPLVIRIRGGSTGSGSVLTEKGRALMDAYDGFAETLSRVAEELCGEYFGDILEVEEKHP